jgi:hypothetical protein
MVISYFSCVGEFLLENDTGGGLSTGQRMDRVFKVT